MKLISYIIVIFGWISIWGIFDIMIDDKTIDEKIKLYSAILGIIVIIVCCFPDILHHI